MADLSTNPMSFDRFKATVPAGSPEHVWLGPLRQSNGLELHTRGEWTALIETIKSQPVSYDNLRRVAAPGAGR